MGRRFKYAGLFVVLFFASEVSLADLVDTFEYAEPTEYCVAQTSVRGDFDNLVIDHQLIISPEHINQTGDVFVGARLKSQPETSWLLAGITWRRIDTGDDLNNSQYQRYDQLPLLVPISILNNPVDIREFIGDLEIWIGYGFRSVTDATSVSFKEMESSGRYELLWSALPPPYRPYSGLSNPNASLCLESTMLSKTVRTVQIPIGETTERR